MRSVINVKDDRKRAENPQQRMHDIERAWMNASHSSGRPGRGLEARCFHPNDGDGSS